MKIQKALTAEGWTIETTKPLVLGASLLDCIKVERTNDNGGKSVIRKATLYHKGDRYVFQWRRWVQSIDDRTSLEDGKGMRSDVAIHFDPRIEAIAVGFEHLLTIDVTESTMAFWKKSEKKLS